VTAEGNQQESRAEEEKKKKILNLTEAWKKMYFESEGTLSKAVDEYVASDSFTEFLEEMGKQYLTMYKATSHNMDRFLANNPIPTKKDIARVCELVVDVEDKVDHLEQDFNGNMAGLASSLIRLVDFQMVLKDEILAVRQEVKALHELMIAMQAGPAGSGGEKTALRRDNRQNLDLVKEKTDSGSIQGQEKETPPKPPARPRSRSKQAPDKK